MAAYVSNGDFSPGNDQFGNMLFSVNLLKRHSLSLGPPDAPDSFFWILERPGTVARSVTIDEWNSAADAAYSAGQLTAPSHHYYLARTVRPGQYVNTFGLGAALAGLPVYAVLDLFVDIEANRWWWWHGSAVTGSLLTALAALFLFLAAREFVAPAAALLIALAFGLGSCAWPISSQMLAQHPPNCFFLCLGAWFLLRSREHPRAAAWCGAALGMAVLCRPVSAVVVVCVGAWLLWVDRRRCAAYVLGGLPFLVILAAYNGYYFGSPLVFGQTLASKAIALADTGSENLWQSSWRDSLPGLLFSPSRGLIWFSPVLVFGFVSAVPVWKEPRYRPLIPLQAAFVLTLLVAGKWFDWQGGAAWGYRPILDVTPFLALLMVPIIERIIAHHGARVLFGALLVWSVAVQFVGAYTYNGVSWFNHLQEYDDPGRATVWSWRGSQIRYHAANFAAERALKRRIMAGYANVPTPVVTLRDGHQPAGAAAEQRLRVSASGDPARQHNLAEALRRQGRLEEALESYGAVLAIDSDYALAHAAMGDTLFRLGRYEEALGAMARAVALRPDLPFAATLHLHMGRAERALGRPAAAEQHFERARAVDPDDVQPLLDLAGLRLARGRLEDADRILSRVREMRPDDPTTLHNVAETLRRYGRYEDAVATYRAAIAIDGGFAPAYAGLGIALFQWERYAEAIEALERSLALQPDLPITGSSLLVFLGRAAERLGRPEAADYLARALRDDPRDREALELLAMLRFGEQRYGEALDLYRTLVEIDPDSAQTHANIGATLYYLDRVQDALLSFQHALALDPALESARTAVEQLRTVMPEIE